MNNLLNMYEAMVEDTAVVTDDKLIYGAFGLASEVGEVHDVLKKMIRNDDGLLSDEARIKLRDELGDVLWYVTYLAHRLQLSLAEVMGANERKLRRRQNDGTIKSRIKETETP